MRKCVSLARRHACGPSRLWSSLKTRRTQTEPGPAGGAIWPRLVCGTITVAYIGLGLIWAERQIRLATRDRWEEVQSRDWAVPNYHHVNNDRDIFYLDKGSGAMNQFGVDYINVNRNWSALCLMDSDYDGFTNGQELGDPCCNWRAAAPHVSYSLARHHEYRRWYLTNPGDNTSSWLQPGFGFPEPVDCDDYVDERYLRQYEDFYYANVDKPVECDPPMLNHLVGVAASVLMFAHWIMNYGLLRDLLPFVFRGTSLGIFTWTWTCLLAFVYMDLTSGMSHLCLDYSPKWIPILGPVANGFQEHHRSPPLLARKRIWNQVNDVFIIMPLPVTFLLGTHPTRVARLFWFWALLFAFLFLLAHPWAHMHRDMVPWPVALAQEWGVLLNQAAHMRHHADLEAQFTILSGHADIVIDLVSQVVPPQRYDCWLFFLATWLLLPVAIDLKYRPRLSRRRGDWQFASAKRKDLVVDGV